jgi:hypothetical protein
MVGGRIGPPDRRVARHQGAAREEILRDDYGSTGRSIWSARRMAVLRPREVRPAQRAGYRLGGVPRASTAPPRDQPRRERLAPERELLRPLPAPELEFVALLLAAIALLGTSSPAPSRVRPERARSPAPGPEVPHRALAKPVGERHS